MADMNVAHSKQIAEAVEAALHAYYLDLGDSSPTDINQMILDAAQKPMLEFVMKKTRYNQCAAAIHLGLNRNTVRLLLRRHNTTRITHKGP